MDRVPNARIREFFGVKKGLDERIDEGVLRWFGHLERIERDMIAKRVCRSVSGNLLWVGRKRDRLIP